MAANAAISAMLAALCLLSALDIHGDGCTLEPVHARLHAAYSPEAVHPTADRHAERATTSERPPCAGCLSRLQTACPPGPTGNLVYSRRFEGAVSEVAGGPRRSGVCGPCLGRAPPLA